jgi:hypothetical protein
MKITRTLLTATLLAATGYAGLASAHNYTYSLGVNNSNVARTDVFSIQCNSGTAKITYQVKDVKTTPTEKNPVIKIRGATTQAGLASATWDSANQLGAFTTLRTINGGTIAYWFEVNKSAATGAATNNGLETYIASIHCLDATNGHNPDDQPDVPSQWIKRNQP